MNIYINCIFMLFTYLCIPFYLHVSFSKLSFHPNLCANNSRFCINVLSVSAGSHCHFIIISFIDINTKYRIKLYSSASFCPTRQWSASLWSTLCCASQKTSVFCGPFSQTVLWIVSLSSSDALLNTQPPITGGCLPAVCVDAYHLHVKCLYSGYMDGQ